MGSLPRSTALVRYAPESKSPSTERRVLTDNTNRQLNHSPVESPPTVKKKLCRLAKGLVEGQNHQGALEGLDAAFVFEAPAVEIAQIALGTVPRSLQSRPRLERSNSATSRSSSILKKQKNLRGSVRTKSANSWPPHKGVKFQDNVTVFRIDDEGSYVCTECQKLRGEPRTTEELFSRNTTGLYNVQAAREEDLRSNAHNAGNVLAIQGRESTPQPHSHTSMALVPSPQQHVVPGGPSVTNIMHAKDSLPSTMQSLEGDHSVNFTFVEDPLHGLKLKFVVPLGLGYGPNDIVVKANMSGSRIRVVANKTTKSSSKVQYAGFNQRYPLPMDVDPYMVTARLDIKGQLIVEAPLMTLARRQSLVSGRQTNSRAAEQAYSN